MSGAMQLRKWAFLQPPHEYCHEPVSLKALVVGQSEYLHDGYVVVWVILLQS